MGDGRLNGNRTRCSIEDSMRAGARRLAPPSRTNVRFAHRGQRGFVQVLTGYVIRSRVGSRGRRTLRGARMPAVWPGIERGLLASPVPLYRTALDGRMCSGAAPARMDRRRFS